MPLRDYQQAAVDSAIEWLRRSKEPGVLNAPTGSGKSHIVASIAEWLVKNTGKRVLCLQPSKELTKQNHEKYMLTGHKASIFSASLNRFCTKYPVVYATDKTVVNRLRRFGDGSYCAIILDEAHRWCPTIERIVAKMREANPQLRVLGLTATPYRSGMGYIYKYDTHDHLSEAIDPPFFKCIYEIDAHYLIEQGHLTRPVVGYEALEAYEVGNLKLTKAGHFSKASVDQAFVGHGRLTASIVQDAVGKAKGRLGVMFFCATVKHAEEVMASLPPGLSAMVTGKDNSEKRAKALSDFKTSRLKYLVNVDVLTTGFDAPNVDTIAILRHTESVALLQQIVGRGLRLLEGKTECLILDYAKNISKHCPDGDLFKPEITTSAKGEGEQVVIKCPSCQTEQAASKRGPNDPQYQAVEMDEWGYYVDYTVPAHYSRRCIGYSLIGGLSERCGYRWAGKDCSTCGSDNDIAARRCRACKAEMVDPNEKLQMEYAIFLKDPHQVHTDKVIAWEPVETLSQAGNLCYRVKVVTPLRSFTIWLVRGSRAEMQALQGCAGEIGNAPHTVTYQKNKNTGFYDISGYNREEDTCPVTSKGSRNE